MNYNEIIRQLAIKENVSVEEIEKEMEAAIKYAELDCSAKEFIETTVALLKQKTIYSRIV